MKNFYEMNHPAVSCEVSQLKKVFRHSAPPQAVDAESSLLIFWIPASAGMTIFLTPKLSFEEFFD